MFLPHFPPTLSSTFELPAPGRFRRGRPNTSPPEASTLQWPRRHGGGGGAIHALHTTDDGTVLFTTPFTSIHHHSSIFQSTTPIGSPRYINLPKLPRRLDCVVPQNGSDDVRCRPGLSGLSFPAEASDRDPRRPGGRTGPRTDATSPCRASARNTWKKLRNMWRGRPSRPSSGCTARAGFRSL